MRPGSLAVAGFAKGSLGGSLKHYQRTPKAPGSPRELGFAGWGLALRVASPSNQPTPGHRQGVVHGPGSLGLRGAFARVGFLCLLPSENSEQQTWK